MRISLCILSLFLVSQSLSAQLSNSDLIKVNQLSGHWKYQYKVVDGDIEYAYIKTYDYGNNQSKGIAIDTFSVHCFTYENGKKKFEVRIEARDGYLEPNDLPSFGSWQVIRENKRLLVKFQNIYYPGSGVLKKELYFISEKKLILVDINGIEYHYKRR